MLQQAENIELVAKARIHSSSVLFRSELLPPYDEKSASDHVIIEMRAAQLMGSLVKEGFFFETINIYSSVIPFLSEYGRAGKSLHLQGSA